MTTPQPNLEPNGLPLLIGSLPLGDHEAAADLVLEYTPETPLWVQLPIYPEEGMIIQFMPGLPGLVTDADKWYIQTSDANFSDKLVQFYEEYMAVTSEGADLNGSRFTLNPGTARGFFVFKEHVRKQPAPPVAVKGQITGPITFATAVKDQVGQAIYYDEQIRDAAIKLLALKARWQVRQLSEFGRPVIVFLDEPALAAYGSSEFISISRQEVIAALNEVIAEIHAENGTAGIHVCANTEWDMIMDTDVDIINFDAYSYFDRFILYPDALKKFIDAGRMIAWGIVPTGSVEAIESATPEDLLILLERQITETAKLGVDPDQLLSRSFVSPSCGTGSLSPDHAVKVLSLTRDVSRLLRESHPHLSGEAS